MTQPVKRKLFNAKTAITIRIKVEHIQRAKCGDPGQCVMAQGFLDQFGELLEGVEVGMTCTKVYTSDKVMRYATPYKVGRALPVWDKLKKWELPLGEYTFGPYVKRPRRWEQAKRQGGVQDIFRGRALPSRRVIRAEALCAA